MLPAPFQPPCCHAESFLTLCVLCSMHRWPPGFSKLDTVLMVQASSPPQACNYHQVSRSGVYADAFRWQLACKCCCIFALLSFMPGSLAQSLQFFGTADAIRESARAPGTCFYRSRSGLLFCCAMTRQGLLRTSICIRTCSCLQQCFVAPMGNANVSSTAASYVISCGSHVEPKKARPPQDCHCILYYETNVKLHLHMGGQDALYQVLACCAYTSRCRRPSPGPLLDDCCEAQPGLCF